MTTDQNTAPLDLDGLDLDGWLIVEGDTLVWTGVRLAAVAALTEGYRVVSLPALISQAREAERMREFVQEVSDSDWTAIDLQYLAFNIRHCQGSPNLKLKRDAASAALTLKAVLEGARALAPATGGGE